MNFIGFLLNEMYIAYVLDKKSRKLLAEKFPPKYPEFVGHHITLNFGVSPDVQLPANAKSIKVVGYADDGKGLEALVVEVNGRIQRPDGSIYHITWSLDRSLGRKPVQSKSLVQSGYTKVDPITIHTNVELLK